MDAEKKDLFGPYTFEKQISMKNRTVVAPMTNMQSNEDGSLNENELRWLSARAAGGFGMVITCASHVRKDAKAWHGQLGIFDDSLLPGLKAVATEMRRHGALSIVQLFHGGMRSTSDTTGQQPVAPSVVHQDFPGFEVPRALEEKEIEQIIQDFKAAAVRAKTAGFDGIEIHGANGYLFTQFLSKATNLRDDKWGGSNANRARFLLRVTEEIRKAVPAPFIVGVRLLPEDTPKARGFDIDETTEVLGWLADRNVDYVHLSGKDVRGNPWKYPEGSFTHVARFRKALPGTVSLIACGGIQTEGDAQAAFREGADLVALGKAAITDPDWPKRAQEPGFKPKAIPMTPDEAKARAISPPFIKYLQTMKMITEEPKTHPTKETSGNLH